MHEVALCLLANSVLTSANISLEVHYLVHKYVGECSLSSDDISPGGATPSWIKGRPPGSVGNTGQQCIARPVPRDVDGCCPRGVIDIVAVVVYSWLLYRRNQNFEAFV
jgi:hypothetical protein